MKVNQEMKFEYIFLIIYKIIWKI